MGLIDSVKNAISGDDNNDPTLIDKAKDLVNKNEERIDAGVDRAGDLVDDKTGGKFESQISQGQEFIKDKTGNL